jgi:hypothetical protein
MVAGAAAALAAPRPARAAPRKVIYYDQGSGLAEGDSFSLRVLQLALAKSGAAYTLKPSPLGDVTEVRAKAAMIAGDSMDVALLGASAEVDAELQPVRIPVERGLLGYRVFVVDARRQADFARVRTLSDLRRLTALQVSGWPDTKILRHAGLPVWTGGYAALYPMMAAGRADYFPRSVTEAEQELASQAQVPSLVLERTLMLRYRFASLFYVAKGAARLHDAIRRGFLAAYDDGSYLRLFETDPGMRAALRIVRRGDRRIIDIDNPLLSPALRAIPERFWFSA